MPTHWTWAATALPLTSQKCSSVESNDRTTCQGKGHGAPAPSALATQVAYDLALIRLARSVGLACQPNDFSQPETQRHELRRALASRGVHLDEAGEHTHSIA